VIKLLEDQLAGCLLSSSSLSLDGLDHKKHGFKDSVVQVHALGSSNEQYVSFIESSSKDTRSITSIF